MAKANSTAMAGAEPAINTLSTEERLGALREENEVLAAALERMEQAIQAVNPLTEGEDAKESAQSVANVLEFMAHVFREGIEIEDSSKAADGAGLILATCAATLNFHFGSKGGAA